AADETTLKELAEALQQKDIDHMLWLEQPENIATCIALRPYPKEEVSQYLKKFRLFKSLCKSTESGTFIWNAEVKGSRKSSYFAITKSTKVRAQSAQDCLSHISLPYPRKALPGEVWWILTLTTGGAGELPEDIYNKHQTHLCVLASNCDEPTYVKLVEALCAEHQINLVKADGNKKLHLS
ncbi:hypothetical protein A6R68_19539, partial [Neotoma lepida]